MESASPAGPERAFAALALEEDPQEAELAARVAALEAEAAALRAPVAEREAAVAEQEAAVARAKEALAALVQGLTAAKVEAARKAEEVAEAKRQLAVHRSLEAARRSPEWRDWGNAVGEGLPAQVLAAVAERVVAQTDAEAWSIGALTGPGLVEKVERQGRLPPHSPVEDLFVEGLRLRAEEGSCLFPFAMVCKEWRKAQLNVGGGRLYSRVISDMIVPGRVELLRWALEEGGCPRERGRNLHRIDFDRERPKLADAAATFGHLELLQWLHKEQGYTMDGTVLEKAVESEADCLGAWELVQWLRAEGCYWGERTCTLAAENGRLGLLQYLRAHGCPWNFHTCIAAAENGHLETLRWARENGCDWNAMTCWHAAKGGELEILQWLRAEGCPWDVGTSRVAAGHGRLEMLRWARENGCPWDAHTCKFAAAGGHLEVLQWLRANGCPWDWHTCYEAVHRGHVEVLRWARENGGEWFADIRDRAAAELGYTDDFGNVIGIEF